MFTIITLRVAGGAVFLYHVSRKLGHNDMREWREAYGCENHEHEDLGIDKNNMWFSEWNQPRELGYEAALVNDEMFPASDWGGRCIRRIN